MEYNKKTTGSSTARRVRHRGLAAKAVTECLLAAVCLPGVDQTIFVNTAKAQQASRLLLAHVLEAAPGVVPGALSSIPFKVDKGAVGVARKALETFLDNSAEYRRIMAVSKSGNGTPGALFSSMFSRASPDVAAIQTLCDKFAARLAMERLRFMKGMLKTSDMGQEVLEVLRVSTHDSVTSSLKDLEFHASPFAVLTAPRVLKSVFRTPSIHLEHLYISLRLAEYVVFSGKSALLRQQNLASASEGSPSPSPSLSTASDGSDGGVATVPVLRARPVSLVDLQSSPFFLSFGFLMGLPVTTMRSTQTLLNTLDVLVTAGSDGDVRRVTTTILGSGLSVFMSPQTVTELEAATGNAWPSVIKALSGLKMVCTAWVELVMACVKPVPPSGVVEGRVPGTRFRLAEPDAVNTAWQSFVVSAHELMGDRGLHHIIKSVHVVARETGELEDGLALFATREVARHTDVEYFPDLDVVSRGDPQHKTFLGVAVTPHVASILRTFRGDFLFVPDVYKRARAAQLASRAPHTAALTTTHSSLIMSPALRNGRERSETGLNDFGVALRFANMAAITVACLGPMGAVGPFIFRLGTTEAPGAFPMIPPIPGSGYVPGSTALTTLINVCTRVFPPAVPAAVLSHHPKWQMSSPAIRRAILDLAYDRLLGLARAGRLFDALPATKQLVALRPCDLSAVATPALFEPHMLPLSCRGDPDVLALAFMPDNVEDVMRSRGVAWGTPNVVSDHINVLLAELRRLVEINVAASRSIVGIAADTQITGGHARVHTMRRMLLSSVNQDGPWAPVGVGAGAGAGAGAEGYDDLPDPFEMLSAQTDDAARRVIMRTYAVMSRRQSRLPFLHPPDMLNDTAEIGKDVTMTALLELTMRVFHAVFYATRRESGPPREDAPEALDEFTPWRATTHVCDVVMAPILTGAFDSSEIQEARHQLVTSVMSKVRTYVSRIGAMTADDEAEGCRPTGDSSGSPSSCTATPTTTLLADEDEDEDEDDVDPVARSAVGGVSGVKTRLVLVKHALTGQGMVAPHRTGTALDLSPELTRAVRLGTRRSMPLNVLAKTNLPDASFVLGQAVAGWPILDPGGDALTMRTARTPSVGIPSKMLEGGSDDDLDSDSDSDSDSSGGFAEEEEEEEEEEGSSVSFEDHGRGPESFVPGRVYVVKRRGVGCSRGPAWVYSGTHRDAEEPV